jgi:hypothetical protein
MQRHYRAQWSFTAESPQELSVHEGEILTEVQPERDSWIFVANAQDKRGYVPANYLQLEEEKAEPLPTLALPTIVRHSNLKNYILAEIECPLSLDIFIRPVQAPCGHLFSEAAIHQWITNSQPDSKCPLCGQPIATTALKPAEQMQALIEKFRGTHGLELPTAPELYPLIQHANFIGKSPHHPGEKPPKPSNAGLAHHPHGKVSRGQPGPTKTTPAALPPAPLPRTTPVASSSAPPAVATPAIQEGDRLIVLTAHAQEDLNVNPGDVVIVQIPDAHVLYVQLESDPNNNGFIPVEKVGPAEAEGPGTSHQSSSAPASEELNGLVAVISDYTKANDSEITLRTGEQALVTDHRADGYVYVEAESSSGWAPARIFRAV